MQPSGVKTKKKKEKKKKPTGTYTGFILIIVFEYR